MKYKIYALYLTRLIDFDNVISLQFLCRVVTQSVLTLGDRSASPATSSPSITPAATPDTSDAPTLPTSPTHTHKGSLYSKWPPLVLRVAKDLGLEVDLFRRHHVCELYSSNLDKLAEEVNCRLLRILPK